MMLQQVGHWLNDNQGILALVLFLLVTIGSIAKVLFRRILVLKSLQSTMSIENYRSFSGYNDHAEQPLLNLSYQLIGKKSIQPVLPYLSQIETGQRIESNFYHNTPFNLSLPKLIIDILNDGDVPVLIKGFTFEIKSSRPVGSPIPVFRPIGEPFSIYLMNEGSVPMKNVSVSFYVSTKESPEPTELDFNYFFEEVSECQEINIAEHLKQKGVDIEYLVEQAGYDRLSAKMAFMMEKNKDVQAQIRSKYDKKIADALGPYSGLPGFLLFVHGNLIYFHAKKKYSIPFTTHTYILCKPHAPPPLAAAYDIEFRGQGDEYQISKKDIHLLGSKEGHRFVFCLSASDWSHHKFDLKVVTDKGTKTLLNNIDIEILLPRTKPQNETAK